MKHLFNPSLPFLLKNYPGNPVSQNGRFYHPDYPFELTWAKVVKWKSRPNPYLRAKWKERWRARVIQNNDFLKNNNDLFVWLGHASFFFCLNGRRILTDPVFGKLSFLMPRYSSLPVRPDQFRNIDYILLTHDHRDHCDLPSLHILAKNNPHVKIICGLNMTPLISHLFKKENITEMGWYQQYTDEKNNLKITYLPTRHWGRRLLTDTNKRLWGAYVLQTSSHTLYFGGDSGYGNHYKKTASLFPNIDFAFLGIGAFAPEWFMHSNHTSPAAAFNAWRDLNARHLIPMHFGTFDLSDEPLGEPLRLLNNIYEKNNLNGEIIFSDIGTSFFISN